MHRFVDLRLQAHFHANVEVDVTSTAGRTGKERRHWSQQTGGRRPCTAPALAEKGAPASALLGKSGSQQASFGSAQRRHTQEKEKEEGGQRLPAPRPVDAGGVAGGCRTGG